MDNALSPSSLLTADDREFLARIGEVHPDILHAFERYLAAPPEARPAMAAHDSTALLRAGWVARNVKNPESVAEHTLSLAATVEAAALPTGTDRERLIRMAHAHDLPEVIITDFTPQQGIARADKDRLELLAAHVLFETQPEERALVEEYVAQETPLAHLLHDFDKLDAVHQALVYEGYYPQKRGKLFQEFRDYAAPRLKTDTGQAHLADIDSRAETIRSTARDTFMASSRMGPRGS